MSVTRVNRPAASFARWLCRSVIWRGAWSGVQQVARLCVGASFVAALSLACGRDESRAQQALSASLDAGAPKLELEARVHDFGTVDDGDVLTHAFSVKNVGSAPLVLSRVHASCGCTSATPRAEEIPPGGVSAIDVTLATRGFPGKTHSTIEVGSNDPNQPSVVLELNAFVEQLLELDRPLIRFAAHGRAPQVEHVWLTGKLAAQAQLAVTSADNAEGISVKPIRVPRGARTRNGLEFRIEPGKAHAGEGRVSLSTGVPDPAELLVHLIYIE